MPLLIVIYLFDAKKLNHSTTNPFNYFFLSGLIFSFLGDLFLLFKWGFLPGLGSFLLAHIFYIFCFKKIGDKKIRRTYIIPIAIYLAVFLIFLMPYLGEMLIPVIIYSVAISLMFYFSLKTKQKWLIAGALLFLISDSILSVNLFVKESALLSVLVMMTYVAAQFLLVKGMISLVKMHKSITKNETF